MIVTIDGPAGTGKSTAARQLAAALGFEFLDTGAMYRAVAVVCLEQHLHLQDQEQVAQVAREATISFQAARTIIAGRDVTDLIRTPSVTEAASVVAQNGDVRAALVQRQQQLAAIGNIVAEGRDQGTVVFPRAECKFYLTADPVVRAERRLQELTARGEQVSLPELLAQQTERDRRDEERAIAPLRPADDAILIDTTGQSPEQVLQLLISSVQQKIRNQTSH